jgi:CRP/FNR family transcriptional regulator, anaerobic regulatory protein
MFTSAMLNARPSIPPFLVRRSGAMDRAPAPSNDGDAAFALRRRAIVRAGSRAPIERVAAFLIAISQNNEYEGRNAHTIPDSLTCGYVAQLLDIDVPLLADLLVSLERQGLVTSSPSVGLELTNLVGLEELADAH